MEVPRPVELARIARELGVSTETFKSLNGELRGRSTPRGVSAYPLRLPKGAGPVLAARLTSIPAAPEYRDRRVTVRKGETLARFAARNKVSVAEICAANDLGAKAKLRRGMVLVVPMRVSGQGAAAAPWRRRQTRPPSSASRSAARFARSRPRRPPSSTPLRSDTATRRSRKRRERMPPSRRASRFRRAVSNRPRGPFRPAGSPSRSRGSAARRGTHTVRKGDTLYRIATRYGVSVEELRQENRIGRKGSIRVGQRLSVPEATGR